MRATKILSDADERSTRYYNILPPFFQCNVLYGFPCDVCILYIFFYVSDVSKVSVLVPGAGLGRLAWEIARLGYTCQGNEWSFFMLFTSNFILNR